MRPRRRRRRRKKKRRRPPSRAREGACLPKPTLLLSDPYNGGLSTHCRVRLPLAFRSDDEDMDDDDEDQEDEEDPYDEEGYGDAADRES